MSVTSGMEMDTDPPDAAVIMMHTRALNDFLGTPYTLEEVAAMNPIIFSMMGAMKRVLYADKPKKD